MRYLLMYWDADAVETGADNDAAFLAELKTWVEGMNDSGTRLYGGPLRDARDAKLLRVLDGCSPGSRARSRQPASTQPDRVLGLGRSHR